jgi:cytochrome c biogenesis protein CcmG/thiol:disulfide interchange protein DsbE
VVSYLSMSDALRTFLLVSIVAVGFSGCRSAEVEQRRKVEPRGLFLKAAQAAEATPAVRYRFEASVVGPDGERRLEGEALLERLDMSGSNFRARLDALETGGRSDEPGHLLAVRQTDDVLLLETANQLVQHGSLYAGGSSLLYRLDPALMYGFYDPRALASEAEATTVVALGRDEIHGEPCEVVRVTYDDDEEDSRWCLGVDDGLPRLMEWIGPDSTATLKIFDIEPLATVTDADFAVEFPEGWEVVERNVGPLAGSLAEPWSLPTASGGRLALEDLRGEVVVLDFWATWCPPCITTLDNLEALQEVYRDRPVRLIAVNAMESGDPAAFLAERGYTFDALLEGDDLHNQVARGSLPAFAVLDPAGNWVGAGTGYYGEGSERYMAQLIERALSALE